jgi:hypothetical protein
MVGHHLPQFGDLDVEDVDQLDLGGHDRRVGVLHRRRLVQLLGAQPLPDRGDLGVEVTAAGPPQRGEDRGPWQAGGAGGSGARSSSSSASAAVRSSKACKAAGKNSRSAERSLTPDRLPSTAAWPSARLKPRAGVPPKRSQHGPELL